MKISIIIIALVSISFSQCKGQEKEVTSNDFDCDSLIEKQQKVFWEQLANFQSTYFADEDSQNYKQEYDFANNKINVFKNKIPYLEIDFILVGSVNTAQKTWTWNRRNASKGKETKLIQVQEFGLKNNCKKLIEISWPGGDKEAWQMTTISNHILKTLGGARHYTPTKYSYVLFTNINKIN